MNGEHALLEAAIRNVRAARSAGYQMMKRAAQRRPDIKQMNDWRWRDIVPEAEWPAVLVAAMDEAVRPPSPGRPLLRSDGRLSVISGRCGEEFIGERRSVLFCSKRCRKAAYVARNGENAKPEEG